MRILPNRNMFPEMLAEKIWEEAEQDNAIYGDISYRGGGLGIRREWLARKLIEELGVDCDVEWLVDRLPRYFGAGCNYLGGGVRGKIFPSNYDVDIIKFFPSMSDVLDALGNLAVTKYEEIEAEMEFDEWSEKATRAVRGED